MNKILKILILIIVITFLFFISYVSSPNLKNEYSTDHLNKITDLNINSKYCGTDTVCIRDFLEKNLLPGISLREDGCFLFEGKVYKLQHSPESDWPNCYNYWYSFEEGTIYTPFMEDNLGTKWIALQQTYDRVNIVFINPDSEIKKVIKVLYK